MLPRQRIAAGFTLIEVLIVVAIVAILAGTILSHLLGSADDAKASTLKHNLHFLEAQLELYRVRYRGRYPTIQDNGLPQLTNATDASGAIGPSGPMFPLGPYVVDMPMNPYDGSKSVTAVAAPGQKTTGQRPQRFPTYVSGPKRSLVIWTGTWCGWPTAARYVPAVRGSKTAVGSTSWAFKSRVAVRFF